MSTRWRAGWAGSVSRSAELLATGPVARALGMRGKENLIRAFGAREIGAGVLTLYVDRDVGLWSRVAGDALDIAALGMEIARNNRKRGNLMIALGMVAGVTLLDVIAAQALADGVGRQRRRRYPARRRNRYHGMNEWHGDETEYATSPVMYWENDEELAGIAR